MNNLNPIPPLLAGAIIALLASSAMSQTVQQDSASAAQAIAIAGGGGSSGRTSRVVTVPNVIPPSFYGANPCSNSASAGAGIMGGGIAFGGQWTERECRLQEWYRFLNMGGQARLAMAYVCDQNADIRRVAAQIGEPCPQDRAAPVVAAPQATRRAERPAFCDSLSSAAERRRYARECG
jgi:hypothetical protein